MARSSAAFLPWAPSRQTTLIQRLRPLCPHQDEGRLGGYVKRRFPAVMGSFRREWTLTKDDMDDRLWVACCWKLVGHSCRSRRIFERLLLSEADIQRVPHRHRRLAENGPEGDRPVLGPKAEEAANQPQLFGRRLRTQPAFAREA